MFTFKRYLQLHESTLTESKNLHLEHLEDEVLNHGKKGAARAAQMIMDIAATLRGHSKSKINITTKWDGSPAIVVGKCPETGKFFVGTKSVFNKRTPKVCYSAADIDQHYEGELASKLKAAHTHLSKLGIEGVLQGDLMFTDDLKEQTIDGDKFVTFQPNTIVYAVPVGSELAKQIQRAKVGIVFHTKYTGTSLSSMSASHNVDVSQFSSPDVWVTDASYKDQSGTITFTQSETNQLYDCIDQINTLINQIPDRAMDELLANDQFVQLLKMHTNSEIRSGSQYRNFMSNLDKFIDVRIAGQKVSNETKDRKRAELKEIVRNNRKTLQQVVQMLTCINKAKILLVDKMNSIKQIDTFLQDGDGFKATTPEGFVAVDHLTNKAVKLVKRLEFSKANFSKNS